MSVLQNLMQHYELPFKLYDFQAETLEEAANKEFFGYYFDPGMGKTISAVLHALHLRQTRGVKHWIVLVPPVVIPSFVRGIKLVSDKNGQPLQALPYFGTPKQRQELRSRFDQYPFIVMSWDIFKMDYDEIHEFFQHNPVGIIADEAQRQKNIKTKSHKAVFMASRYCPVLLLSGSPTTVPEDAYAYMRFTNPRAYPTFNNMLRKHVVLGDDPYGRDKTYKDLHILKQNFHVNAKRLYKRDYLKDLPPITYTPIFYDLDPKHLALYRRIADEKLVELESGGMVDGTTPSRLFQMLQQIIVNYGVFAEDDKLESAALKVVEDVLDEIGQEKLVVSCSYRRSNELVCRKFQQHNPVSLMGGLSSQQRDVLIQKFVKDKSCRLMVIHPKAAGEGVDGLQHVCSEMLFLECPTTAPVFYQVASRLERGGQTRPVNCRIAVAQGTLQMRHHRALLNNDEMIARIEGGTQDLRAAIYGD